MKLNFSLLVLFLMSFNANAYFIAANTDKIDSTKPTHIFMAGNPENLGELFLYSVLTKSQTIKEKYPENQIIIVGRNQDKAFIARSGFKIHDSNISLLKSKALGKAFDLTQNIRSIDIYGHSNAVEGIIVDKNVLLVSALSEDDIVWDKLSSKLSQDSYIMIHGCNAGVKMAPDLAKKLNIAVLAALTGSDFQKIYSNKFWTQDFNVPLELQSPSNRLSLIEEKECKKGYCTRMKPDNSSYKGVWGDWSEGGYPAYKIFCGSNNGTTCKKGALEAIISFPSTIPAAQVKTLDQFKEVATDFLCPFESNPEKQAECKNSLEKSLTDEAISTYSPFRGTTLSCDFVKCFAHFKCGAIASSFNPGKCKLTNEKPGANSTFTNEYKFLVEAFLQKDN